MTSSSTWSSMKNSVLDQSGNLQTRGSDNVRKECCEWSAVTCRNEKTSSVQVYNCQTLNLQGGVEMQSRERNSLRKENQETTTTTTTEQVDEPVRPRHVLPWPRLHRKKIRKREPDGAGVELGTSNDDGAAQQLLVKRPRSSHESDILTNTDMEGTAAEIFRSPSTYSRRPECDHWSVLATSDDSGLRDAAVSAQLCNAILLPADYHHIADNFPTIEDHVAGARTRCYEALAYVTALEQRMMRQQNMRGQER